MLFRSGKFLSRVSRERLPQRAHLDHLRCRHHGSEPWLRGQFGFPSVPDRVHRRDSLQRRLHVLRLPVARIVGGVEEDDVVQTFENNAVNVIATTPTA